MPGSNNGTGHPIIARCGRCKRNSFLRRRKLFGFKLELTGRRKQEKHGGSGTNRIDPEWLYEYRCRDCGNQGWSRHIDLAVRWHRDYAGASL